jgi:hypothetical protein
MLVPQMLVLQNLGLAGTLHVFAFGARRSPRSGLVKKAQKYCITVDVHC